VNWWQFPNHPYRVVNPYRLNLGASVSQSLHCHRFFGSNSSALGELSSASAPVLRGNPSRMETAVGDKILDINSLAIPEAGQSGTYSRLFGCAHPIALTPLLRIQELSHWRALVAVPAGFLTCFQPTYPSFRSWRRNSNTPEHDCNVRFDNVPIIGEKKKPWHHQQRRL